MKKFAMLAIAAAALSFAACSNKAEKQAEPADTLVNAAVVDSNATDSLADYFVASVDKYPTDIKIFERIDLKDRMVTLMGSESYNVLKTNFNTETPLTKEGDVITASACKAHECGNTEFAIQYNTKTGKLSVKYKVDGKEQVFAEK